MNSGSDTGKALRVLAQALEVLLGVPISKLSRLAIQRGGLLFILVDTSAGFVHHAQVYALRIPGLGGLVVRRHSLLAILRQSA